MEGAKGRTEKREGRKEGGGRQEEGRKTAHVCTGERSCHKPRVSKL